MAFGGKVFTLIWVMSFYLFSSKSNAMDICIHEVI